MNYMPIRDESEKLDKNYGDIESLRQSLNSFYINITKDV